MRVAAVDLFRERLHTVLARSGLTAAGFSRAAGVDRSTLSQLLDGRSDRLPRAETLIAIARFGHVSTDWLLGLSQREEVGAEIIEAILQIETAPQGPVDDRFFDWLRQAAGYRIRTVPVTWPDFLKTDDVLRFEYAEALSVDPETRVRVAQSRLMFFRQPDTALEAAFALESLDLFAAGAGRWRGLPARVRREGLEHMRRLCRDLYPGLRLYLYDQRRISSVPFTVFGPTRVALYLGESYLVFSTIEHIRLFSQRFDDLIRAASVLPHEVDTLIGALIAGIAD